MSDSEKSSTSNTQLSCSKWDHLHKLILSIAVLYVSQSSSLPQPNSSDLNSNMLDSVLKRLELDRDTLPDRPTEQDVLNLSKDLPSELHIQALHDLVIIALDRNDVTKSEKKQVRYGAKDRRLIFGVANTLDISPELVYHAERIVAQELFTIFKQSQDASSPTSHDQTLAERSRSAISSATAKSSWMRYAGAGAGVVLGGVAIGLTGGLAAPLIAPLLVTLSGGALGFLASAGGAVVIGTLFGIAGGGLTGYRAQRRLKGVEEFEFERISPQAMEEHVPSLHATIVCSGFLLNPTDYRETWKEAYSHTIDDRDVFAIKLETKALLSAGKTLETFVRDSLIHHGATEVLKRTALAAVYTAVALPAVVYKTASLSLDNEFQRVRDKCEKAGILLADMIEADAHGTRPLTLVASSMGAITIFNALLQLAKRGVRDSVDEVILIGAPLSPTPAEWESVKTVVAGRMVNVYSRNDWVLAILVRLHSMVSSRMSTSVAGLGSVEVEGVEEVDVSDIVSGHLELGQRLKDILERVGVNR